MLTIFYISKKKCFMICTNIDFESLRSIRLNRTEQSLNKTNNSCPIMKKKRIQTSDEFERVIKCLKQN